MLTTEFVDNLKVGDVVWTLLVPTEQYPECRTIVQVDKKGDKAEAILFDDKFAFFREREDLLISELYFETEKDAYKFYLDVYKKKIEKVNQIYKTAKERYKLIGGENVE